MSGPSPGAPSPLGERGEGVLLQVRDLRVTLESGAGPPCTPVDGISLQLDRGELLAVVGESGAGKSTAALAMLGLTAPSARVQGSIRFGGQELVGAGQEELRRIRGAEATLVPQDAGGALDPLMRVGAQIVEQIRAHKEVSRSVARARAVELLTRAGLSDGARVARAYPHELSGGMRQRALIAMALSCEPRLLICDEPTSALDRTVEARILALLASLRQEGLGVLLVTHDLGVVERAADRVAVMRAGQIVEEGPARSVLTGPGHPYTAALVDAVPWLEGPRRRRLPEGGIAVRAGRRPRRVARA